MSAYDPQNIFAKILRGEIPAEKIYEDDTVLAFMDVMPRANGHVLVIPKIEARNILDAPPEALADLIRHVQKIARAAQKALRADGVTLHQFNEAAGGQSVYHLHFHIIPRWDGEALKPHGGKMADPAALREHADKIRAALKED